MLYINATVVNSYMQIGETPFSLGFFEFQTVVEVHNNTSARVRFQKDR